METGIATNSNAFKSIDGKLDEILRKINNGNLCEEIKSACDDMFAHLVSVTGLPRGYIDVVLWRGLQQGLIR